MLYLIAFFAIISITWSCTKEMQTPLPASKSSVTDDESALNAGEFLTATVTPGTYAILKFVDSGDERTALFNGYTFRFRSDETLVVTTAAGHVFKGTWKLRDDQTRMTISISGNRALKNLDDDDWTVVKITNQRISLKKPGPDRVIFVIQ